MNYDCPTKYHFQNTTNPVLTPISIRKINELKDNIITPPYKSNYIVRTDN